LPITSLAGGDLSTPEQPLSSPFKWGGKPKPLLPERL
jgi:hypothetical protein